MHTKGLAWLSSNNLDFFFPPGGLKALFSELSFAFPAMGVAVFPLNITGFNGARKPSHMEISKKGKKERLLFSFIFISIFFKFLFKFIN